MTKQATPSARKPSSMNATNGTATVLDRNTPTGLFEARSGNKYIVTKDLETKVAVALVHWHLEPFTYMELGSIPLEQGRWIGDYQLTLTHARSGKYNNNQPGLVSLGEGCAVIDCWDPCGKVGCIALGVVEANACVLDDFDGWEIHAPGSRKPFFARRRRTSNISLILEPKQEVRQAAA